MSSSLASSNTICPICGKPLRANGPLYGVDELFEMWKPIKFSARTIEEHRQQSSQTQMYSCAMCCLDIFLPQILGTPAFYVEAYSLNASLSGPEIFTYSDDKWDFHEALKCMSASRSALEVGCGPGNFLAMVAQHVQEVRGIEYNEPALELARSKGLKVFRSLEDLDVKKEHFDVAFSFHVLEHVADPVSFLKEMSTWVRPGGTIGLSVPNQDGPIKYITPCITNMPPHHLTRWRLQTLRTMAEKLGLVVTHVGYEPLLLQNHSYYSLHWLNHRFKGGGLAPKLIRRILSRGMNTLFGALIKLNRKHFRFLCGQSIYVSMLKSRE
jgi:2-polyprenyl-3-methyl-5-hydroxy-6-metoxy-1,4-benzoquinol methylase